MKRFRSLTSSSTISEKIAIKNKVLKVFITGATSGIGESLARQYSDQGATLGLVGRRLTLLQEIKSKIKTPCEIYGIDVTHQKDLERAANHFIKKHGAPDIIVANAGVSTGTLAGEREDLHTFKRVIEINLIGVIHTFLPFIKILKKRKSGQLVGIASVAGVRGLPGSSAYSTSKAALINYLESLRIEMKPFGIHVTTIAPGYIHTPMTKHNRYAMPFILDVDIAVSCFIKAIQNKKRFIIIPWQMNIIVTIMKVLPSFLWDFLAKGGPKKIRKMIQ
jgi:short-subunit dehydrogenase